MTVDRALTLAEHSAGRPAPDGRRCATDRRPGAGARLERRGALLHRRLRRHRPGRGDAAHRTVRAASTRPIRGSWRPVRATEAELRSGATVYRYHRDDGLPGSEGGFHLCAAWLIEAYLLIGRALGRRGAVRALVDAAGPTGLLARGVRPGGRARARQPPAGVQPSRPAALRAPAELIPQYSRHPAVDSTAGFSRRVCSLGYLPARSAWGRGIAREDAPVSAHSAGPVLVSSVQLSGHRPSRYVGRCTLGEWPGAVAGGACVCFCPGHAKCLASQSLSSL